MMRDLVADVAARVPLPGAHRRVSSAIPFDAGSELIGLSEVGSFLAMVPLPRYGFPIAFEFADPVAEFGFALFGCQEPGLRGMELIPNCPELFGACGSGAEATPAP